MGGPRSDSTSAPDGPVPYRRYAFHNLYNYTVMGGFAAAALLNQNWWLLVLGGACEALWMLFGPDSRLVQRAWLDQVHKSKLDDAARRAFAKKLQSLPQEQCERVLALVQKRHQVLQLAGENKAFTIELMKGELDKLEKLVDSFADMAVASHRYECYLESVDFNALEAEIRRQERLIERSQDAGERELAQKNLSVLKRRQEKLAEVKSFVTRARAQMTLIENSFELLADQIVTMRSPAELDGQLDDLIDGVEAVRSTAREAESLLEAASSSRVLA